MTCYWRLGYWPSNTVNLPLLLTVTDAWCFAGEPSDKGS